MSSRQIREKIQREFGGYSWDGARNDGNHSPDGGVSPRTISLDDAFVRSAYRSFSREVDVTT